jgi:DNA-binding response OmpR family regulator
MAKRTSQATGEASPSPPLPGLEILIIEDEALVAFDLEELLFQEGARSVEITSSVRAAREILAARRFSAAILDIKLSDGSGLELLPLLRQLQIPVIITTGYSGLEVDQLLIVQKPYSGQELINAILTLSAGV